jgi:pimeloyl-ACP methyl ester carboxylesterase
MSASAPAGRGPRLLCLHGYCQNGAVLRAKTHALRKALQRACDAELVYVDAPHVVPERPGGGAGGGADGQQHSIRQVKRTWWVTTSPDGTPSSSGGREYAGWDATLRHVCGVFEDQGPFDGVLAFSQGAVLAHVLAAISRPDALPPPPPGGRHAWLGAADGTDARIGALSCLRFAILVSGFPSRARAHERLVGGAARRVPLPSMHVWGRRDELVPAAASEALMRLFDADGRDAVVHDGGHCVPQRKAERDAMATFVARFAAK